MHKLKYTVASKPNALSVTQCDRLRNNQWLTDEVSKDFHKMKCIQSHVAADTTLLLNADM